MSALEPPGTDWNGLEKGHKKGHTMDPLPDPPGPPYTPERSAGASGNPGDLERAHPSPVRGEGEKPSARVVHFARCPTEGCGGSALALFFQLRCPRCGRWVDSSWEWGSREERGERLWA